MEGLMGLKGWGKRLLAVLPPPPIDPLVCLIKRGAVSALKKRRGPLSPMETERVGKGKTQASPGGERKRERGDQRQATTGGG